MKRVLLATICLSLLATSALAQREVIIKPLEDLEIRNVGPSTPGKQDCLYGNTNDPAVYVEDWIWGNESYAYFFDPLEQTCGCASGFLLESVHMLMQFGTEDVPVTFEISAELREALPPGASACWTPGVAECVSQVYSVTVTTPGLYDIPVPIADDCACAYLNYNYFLVFNVVTAFAEAARPDAITDNTPVNCLSLFNYESGWQDLVGDYGYPGGLKLWGEILCCDDPVPDDGTTWGRVKDLYR